MAILKLSPTQAHTVTVQSAAVVQGQYGEQVQFTTTDNDLVFVSVNTAQRQLDRLGIDLQTVAGETLEFSQVRKDNKTFTNINRANGKATQPRTQPPGHYGAPGWLEEQEQEERGFVQQQVAPKPAVDRWAALFAHYDRCMEYVLTVEVPKLKKAGVEPTNEGVSAMCSTLLIQASQKGIAA